MSELSENQQLRVAALVAAGCSVRGVALWFGVTPKTVRKHAGRLVEYARAAGHPDVGAFVHHYADENALRSIKARTATASKLDDWWNKASAVPTEP